MKDHNLHSKAPEGDLHTKWEDYKKTLNTLSVDEANKYKVIIIGTGLAGASAAAISKKSTQHCSPRRNQCSKKLQKRWRQRNAPFL